MRKAPDTETAASQHRRDFMEEIIQETIDHSPDLTAVAGREKLNVEDNARLAISHSEETVCKV